MIDLDNPTSRRKGNPWAKDDDDPLWLLTPEELDSVPDGWVVHDILGGTFVVGAPGVALDDDTRAGYTAFGFRESQLSRPTLDTVNADLEKRV